MKITRIYNDEAGKSHFGEVEIALKDFCLLALSVLLLVQNVLIFQ